MSKRPVVFVGSSTEGFEYAKALQTNLDYSCQVVLWSQGVFGLSKGTLEDLACKLGNVDFGVLVVTPDDMVESRGERAASPRDNVLLELGMCIGALGRERSFLIYDRTCEIKLPSDLAGITHANFQPHDDGNAQAALGAASTAIETKINELGIRLKIGQVGIVDEDSQFRVIADLLGIIASNFIIQMLENNASLVRESKGYMSISTCWYGIHFPQRHRGNGRFSVNDLCEKLPDANILSQDLKNSIKLTERGKSLAKWLLENGYKAQAFISPLGEWGILDAHEKKSALYYRDQIDKFLKP